MQAFNYKLSLATTKAKLGMDIYRLNQLVRIAMRVTLHKTKLLFVTS